MQSKKAIVTFDQSILWLKFIHGIDINKTDMQEIYEFADRVSKGAPFALLFDAAGTDDLKEEVVTYVAKNPLHLPIKAKAYVITELQAHKLKLHIAFDKPEIKPAIFSSKNEALKWLAGELAR